METTWTDEPATCQCKRMIVETLEETLACPLGWKWVAGIERWVHQ